MVRTPPLADAGPSEELRSLAESHSLDSSLRERVLEHLFVGELLKVLWRKGRRDIEVLRAEVDRGGYDLVIACGGHWRHIQLKASHRAARARSVKIHIALGKAPSGCVIWIHFDADTLELGPFYWFGAKPGAQLPDLGNRVARHTKGNSKGEKGTRPNIRELLMTRFHRFDSVAEIATALFNV